jgi:hypothetical protein
MLPTLIIEGKAKFQLEISENRVVIFFPHLSSRTPWNLFTDPSLGIRGPPVKNSCCIRIRVVCRLENVWHS